MNKRNLLNLGLLGLVALLVLLVVFEPGIEKPAPTPLLLPMDPQAINHITIQREGQGQVVLAKEGERWWMVEPVRHPAEPYRIDSLLRITNLKSQSSFTAGGGRLGAYQLDEPRATITFNGTTTLAFGGATPLDQRRYVMLNGRIHLTTDSYYYHLIGSFPTFLRRQLLDPGSSIEALQLPGLELSWQQERWQLSPEPEGYSADQVTRLLDNWRLASALEVKPYDGQPGERIAIKVAASEQPIELLLTSRSPDLVLAHPQLGIQYHLDASSAAGLLQLPAIEEQKEGAETGSDAGDDEDGTAAEANHAH